MYYAKATLEGTANYASATSEPAKIEILNATFSVKADDYTDTYDGKPHTVTVTADGAKVSYSADAGNYKTYGSTAPTFTDVGEYTLTPGGRQREELYVQLCFRYVDDPAPPLQSRQHHLRSLHPERYGDGHSVDGH